MNRFYFGSSDSSDSGDDNLPYPKPLTRAAFLTPDFDPTTFLSSLHNRHQTLEDLRAELRSRSQELNKELLDLVNENYQDFLSLGSSLKGGEDKIEEARVGLLGFRRDVEGLKDKVEAKKKEVEGLVTERKAIREDIQLGRTLLEVDLRSQELEERLMLSSSKSPTISDDNEGFSEATDSEDDTEDEGAGGMPTSRLQRHVQQYLYITKLSAKIGSNHPFLVNQQGRLTRLKNTVLLDLNNALRQSLKFSDQLRVMKVLGLYRDMDAPEEPTEILRTMKH